MKYFFYTIFLVLSFSCSIDNYKMPDAKLVGNVIDSETLELIENSGVNNGTLIHLFEGNSTQPIVSYSYPNGHFVNNALFKAKYKVVAIGAFKMNQESMDVDLSQDINNLEIKVIPNMRLNTSITNSDDTSVKVKVKYQKTDRTQTIKQITVLWSTIDNPNMHTTFGGGVKIENISDQDLSTGDFEFSITNLNPDKEYFIRAAGQTDAAGGYYNYSKTIKVRSNGK